MGAHAGGSLSISLKLSVAGIAGGFLGGLAMDWLQQRLEVNQVHILAIRTILGYMRPARRQC